MAYANVSVARNCTLLDNNTRLNCTTTITNLFNNETLNTVVNRPGFVALVQVIGMFVCMTIALIVYMCCKSVTRRNVFRRLQQLPVSPAIFVKLGGLSERARTLIVCERVRAEKLHAVFSNVVPRATVSHFGWDENASINYKNIIALSARSARANMRQSSVSGGRKSQSIRDVMEAVKKSSVALQHTSLCEEYIALCEASMYSPEECTETDYENTTKCIKMILELLGDTHNVESF
jgi:hypothetical protein